MCRKRKGIELVLGLFLGAGIVVGCGQRDTTGTETYLAEESTSLAASDLHSGALGEAPVDLPQDEKKKKKKKIDQFKSKKDGRTYRLYNPCVACRTRADCRTQECTIEREDFFSWRVLERKNCHWTGVSCKCPLEGRWKNLKKEHGAGGAAVDVEEQESEDVGAH